MVRRKTNRRHMTGDHQGRTSEKATLQARAADDSRHAQTITPPAAQANRQVNETIEFPGGTGTGQVTWKMKSARENTSPTPKPLSRKRNAFPM